MNNVQTVMDRVKKKMGLLVFIILVVLVQNVPQHIRKMLKEILYLFSIVIITLSVYVAINNNDNNSDLIKEVIVGELWVMPDTNDNNNIVVFAKPLEVEDGFVVFNAWNYNAPNKKELLSLTILEFSILFVKLKNKTNIVGDPPTWKPKKQSIIRT